MKCKLLLTVFVLLSFQVLTSQVTQINSNQSLQFNFPISSSKTILVSEIDQTVWVTDGTLAGTLQLSATIKFDESLGSITFLDGKLIFAANTPALGSELYITDGTPAGTILLKDINPGATGSAARVLAPVNGFIYFTAQTLAEGNELWRTNGTPAGTTLVMDINAGAAGSGIGNDETLVNGFLFFSAETATDGRELWKTNGATGTTTLVKDIVPGSGGSNYAGNYHLYPMLNNNSLLFMARTPSSGVELWKSDGTDAGTVLLKDINPGSDSSAASFFQTFNNLVFFAANDGVHGNELWKTDGTVGGTTLFKDINLNAGNAMSFDFFGTVFPIFTGFHLFNNLAIFRATDGVSIGELWVTDGTSANTSLLKDIIPGTGIPVFTFSAFDLPNKFIFPVFDPLGGRSELWESDGTTANTKLLKAFDGTTPPSILAGIPFNLQTFSPAWFQGNKVFFTAETVAEGNELWITDGTAVNTKLVKDINPGSNGSVQTGSYIYTVAALYFAANTAASGPELWKSDGTTAGTSMVADIVTGGVGSNPGIFFFLVNGKILFTADNSDSPTATDLYAVDGVFTPLPVVLADFTVHSILPDAILNWRTLQEINSKSFTIQRSYDAINFQDIGSVAAAATSAGSRAYSYTDAGIMNIDKSIIYYRLISVDIDGKSSLSPVIKLKNSRTWELRLLNNPVTESINISLSGVTKNLQISIIDMGGKKMFTHSYPAINGQIILPAANLPKGRYVLLTQTGNENKIIQFVK